MWAKFDDAYSDHPKVIAAGSHGELLDMRAIIWCSRWTTDGAIPREALAVLGRGIPKIARVAERLVDVGRWEATDGGWVVHDFLTYNPSAEKVVATKAARADAGRRGGAASGTSRKQTGSKRFGKPEAEVNPGPVPVPEVLQSESPNEVVAVGPGWTPSPESTAAMRDEGYSDKLLAHETRQFIDKNLAKGTQHANPDAAWRAWVRHAAPDRLALADQPAADTYERCRQCNYPLLADGSCDECARRKRDSTPLTASARRAGAEAARRAREALADGTMGRLAEGGM